MNVILMLNLNFKIFKNFLQKKVFFNINLPKQVKYESKKNKNEHN